MSAKKTNIRKVLWYRIGNGTLFQFLFYLKITFLWKFISFSSINYKIKKEENSEKQNSNLTSYHHVLKLLSFYLNNHSKDSTILLHSKDFYLISKKCPDVMPETFVKHVSRGENVLVMSNLRNLNRRTDQ